MTGQVHSHARDYAGLTCRIAPVLTHRSLQLPPEAYKARVGKVSLEERQANLRHEISERVEEGYRVQHTTETTALLVKPKTFSFFWAFVWFLLFGVGILIYFHRYHE